MFPVSAFSACLSDGSWNRNEAWSNRHTFATQLPNTCDILLQLHGWLGASPCRRHEVRKSFRHMSPGSLQRKDVKSDSAVAYTHYWISLTKVFAVQLAAV